MNRSRTVTATLIAALALTTAGGLWAQEALTAALDASGLVRVSRGEAELATVELNAHGPGWQHAPQESATAQVSPLPGEAGRRFVGSLPIPNTEGGAIQYTQTVRPLPQGLRLEYDLTVMKSMRLNGLQLSICVPVGTYGGKELLVSEPLGEAQITGLPVEPKQTGAQVWSGQGARVQVAAGTDDAVTIELRAATDVVVQDLRQWERPVFEIRLPAIMEDPGREVSADDRFHLDLTVTFAAPVRLEAP